MLSYSLAKMLKNIRNKNSSWLYKTKVQNIFNKSYCYHLCVYSKHSITEKNRNTHSFNQLLIRQLRTDVITSDNIVLSPYDDFKLINCLLHERIWENVDKWSDKTAIECGVTKRNYTFSQLRKYSKTFAASLLKSGVKPGEIISVVLPNLPEYPIVVLGGIEAGVIVSTVNPTYNTDEIYNQISGSKPVCIVTFADKLVNVREAAAKLEHKYRRTVKIVSMQNHDGTSREYPSGVWSLQEMFQSDVDTSIVDLLRDVKPDDVAVIPYSSGTTGLPKGVCLTQFSINNNNEAMCQPYNKMNRPTEGNYQDVSLAVLPFYHIYGLAMILMYQLRLGGKVVTLPVFNPQTYLNALKEHNITILHTVPPLLLFIGTHPDVNKDMFRNVHDIVCGAAPLRENETKMFLQQFPEGITVRQAYGLTEASPGITFCPHGNKSLSTVGPPISLTQIKIIDQSGKSLGVREHGELCARGPQIMKGYFNNPEATASTIDQDGWFHTGDIGYYDENGYFYIVDRIKEIINVRGYKVAPAELEEVLRCHPKVVDAAVIGVPDERSGETPIAYIITKHGSITAEELINYVAGNVTKYKRITKVIFTDTIPKSAAGKILRRTLRDEYKLTN